MPESSKQPDKFTVDRVPDVTVEIRRLVARAKNWAWAHKFSTL